MFVTLRKIGCLVVVFSLASCGLAFGQRGRGGYNSERPARNEGGGQVDPVEIIKGVGGILDGLSRLPQNNGGDDGDDDEYYDNSDYSYPTQPNYYYQPSLAPSYAPTAPATAIPPANKVPSQKTSISAPTKTNSKLLPKALQLTSADLDASKAAMEKRVAGQLKDAVDAALPSSDVANAVANLPTPPYTAAEKLQIRDAVNEGDVGKIAILSKGSSPEITKLQDMAAIHEKADKLQEKIIAGEASTADFRKFQNDLEAVAPATAKADIADSIATLKVQNEVSNLLNTAVPGNGLTSLPMNDDLSLISLPGLPQGQLISLGNGAAIVGGGPNSTLSVSTGNPTGSLGVSIAPGTPVPSGSGSATISGTVLSNPAENDSSISYLMNGSSYTMQAGYQQPLAAGTTWTLSFDPGNGSGTQTQTLGTGTYEFVVDGGSWIVRKKQVKIEIDNRDNSVDFHYVIGANSYMVRGGESATHSGESNIALAFDDGAGKTETKSLASGTYRVGVTDEGDRVDLFTGERAQSEVIHAKKPRSKAGESKIGSLFGR